MSHIVEDSHQQIKLSLVFTYKTSTCVKPKFCKTSDISVMNSITYKMYLKYLTNKVQVNVEMLLFLVGGYSYRFYNYVIKIYVETFLRNVFYYFQYPLHTYI